MIDIVFSFDTTGSMAPCISEVRRKVVETVDHLFSTVDNLHIGIITHGDYCDANMITDIKLTDDKAALIKFVQNAPRTGGGDADEAYEYVLDYARGFNWRTDAQKVLVIIGDADPHETGYTYGRTTVMHSWRSLSQQLPREGISVYAVQCLGNYSRKGFYQTLARDSGTPKLELAQFANITQLLTAVVFKQQSNDLVVEYGNQLRDNGQLTRDTARILNLLLDAENLIGGLDYAPVETSDSGDLTPVPPWRFQVLDVDHTVDILSFVNSTGATFKRGKGFYQLTKSELVQEHKEVVLQSDKGDLYSGKKARDMIGLPFGTRGTVTPRNIPAGFKAFIQSTSNNRKLMGRTKFLYEVDHV